MMYISFFRTPQQSIIATQADHQLSQEETDKLNWLFGEAALFSTTTVEGTFVGPRAVISVGAELGKFVIVNARAGVGHDSKLGDFSQVCPGATLSGHTIVGEHAYLASNACTVPGVRIGARAKIAAGLPVYANVGEGETLSPFGVFRS